MDILVIDGQGGKMGRELIEVLRACVPGAAITAVGTNSIATASMLKASPDFAATGENAVLVACRSADAIVGPVGIVIADSFLGEITPQMAVAVGQSRAKKVLIPVNKCANIIVGAEGCATGELIRRAAQAVFELDSAAKC